MILPPSIQYCITTLESAGFEAWCVGGCVRDWLLGLTPHDHDLCTDATPEQLQALFGKQPLVLTGLKHGTVTVILDHQPVEITTYRTEGGYADGRHPDWVRFVRDIRQDLARRDFTVNAMAWSPGRGLFDPFGGEQDLKNKCLRAVGDPAARFHEDALRILRGVRFSLRFGLTPEPQTLAAMLSLTGLMDNLARERVLSELLGLLPHADARSLVLFAPVLTQVIPELKPSLGFDQHSRHHLYDVYTHTARVVEALPPDPVLRLAGLLHDVAKPQCFFLDEKGQGHFYGHEQCGAKLAGQILHRLKAGNELKSRVCLLIERHMTLLVAERRALRRRLAAYGRQGLLDQLALQRADRIGTGTGSLEEQARTEALLQTLLQEDSCLSLSKLSINGRDLMALGYTGSAIGKCLNRLLAQVVDEQLPNTREALLKAAKENFTP